MPITATSVTLAEYLRTDYEPECELIAGELWPKPMGTKKHVRLAKRIEELLGEYENRGLGYVDRELSYRHGDDVRIPDLVFHAVKARLENDILIDPPILCVEVLSPSQRQSELFAKCEVYHSWGVPYCWVVDPVSRSAWEYHAGNSVRSINVDGILSAGEITLPFGEVFN